MDTEREKFRKLAERETEFREKAVGIEKELPKKEAAQGDLDSKALRAETLGEKDWEKAKATAAQNQEAIRLLREELARTKEGISILQGEKEKHYSGALAEIREEYRVKFAPVLKDVYLKLKVAEEAKVELRKIQDAANKAALDIGIQGPGLLWDRPVSLQGTGQPNFLYGDFLEEFRQRSAQNGYKLE